MKNYLLLPALAGLALLSGCDSLEKTDMIKSDIISNADNREVLYQVYLTGLDKYRYVYKMVENRDTTQLFEARFTDETANNMEMEIEQDRQHLTIKLDRDTPTQTKTINGFTYKLEGSK